MSSFGDNGELIHPRFENGEARHSVLPVGSAAAVSKSSAMTETPEMKTDSAELGSPDDIAMRLDSLLDDKGSKPS